MRTFNSCLGLGSFSNYQFILVGGFLDCSYLSMQFTYIYICYRHGFGTKIFFLMVKN